VQVGQDIYRGYSYTYTCGKNVSESGCMTRVEGILIWSIFVEVYYVVIGEILVHTSSK
jgi:hypothetical protein